MSKKPFPHIIPKIEDWPIYRFAQKRQEFIDKLVNYTFDKIYQEKGSVLQELLSKSIYMERNRAKNHPWKVDPADEAQYWNNLGKKLTEVSGLEESDKEMQLLLRRMINRYSEEIIGDFKPKTFRLARRIIKTWFKFLLNKFTASGQRAFWGSEEDIKGKFKIYGEVEALRDLFKKGTVVIVPTHYSNLDSQTIGFAVELNIGIPAFLYGAGLNLFDYEILAYLMNRLGTYRVDRRKKNPIYLATLKSMASLSVAEGVNNIFFPGGTRSRNGKIENRLKLGLLNSVVEAQQYLFEQGKDEKIFIVPMTMSYHFVLEAKSLIKQYLKKSGTDKFQPPKNRVGFFRQTRHFIWTLFRKSNQVHISFGKPMDVLGNRVDENGDSLDANENALELINYFKSVDGVNKDPQRESIYTKVLAQKITAEYLRINTILSSELIAYCAFKILEETYPSLDAFGIFKTKTKDFSIPKEKMLSTIKSVMSNLRMLRDDGVLSLSDILEDDNNDELAILDDGMKYLGVFHPNKPLRFKDKSTIICEDFLLLYYYHNKIDGYNLDVFKGIDRFAVSDTSRQY